MGRRGHYSLYQDTIASASSEAFYANGEPSQ
jgi:hypothetical protein